MANLLVVDGGGDFTFCSLGKKGEGTLEEKEKAAGKREKRRAGTRAPASPPVHNQ